MPPEPAAGGAAPLRLAVVGAGAWGTALAVLAAGAGHRTTLVARRAETAAALAAERANRAYLPDVPFPPGLGVRALPEGLAGAALVMIAVPAQHLREICDRLRPVWPAGAPAVICAKGIETATGLLPIEVLGEALPGAAPFVLSGPTFAAEVSRGLPTAAVLAGTDAAAAGDLAARLATRHFRLYRSSDPVGVQVGGALKNVIAIAAGIVAGKALGENARAALVTRGLAEMARLGAALGADQRTFMGLSGLGDLVLTCASRQSRNFALGERLGAGEPLARLLAGRITVAEGVETARAAAALAGRLGVDLPISRAVAAVLHEGAALDDAIAGLLDRPLAIET